jgi:hypothetical protein
LGELGIGGTIILNISKKQEVRVKTGLISLRAGISGRIF